MWASERNYARVRQIPGHYVDAETGKHYNYFRDYDPSIGRYLESDPIGLDGGLNTYLYANANALTFFDEDGRSPSIILRGGPAAMAWCMKSPRCKKQFEEWEKKFKDFCDDFRCELRRDNKPHPFAGLGNCEHYQLTCWVDKKKQSDMHVYWPIPGTCRGGPGPNKPTSE